MTPEERKRITRLEKIVSLLIKGGTIMTEEKYGWGITREELEYLRKSYMNIREEHHFSNDDLQKFNSIKPEDEKEQSENHQEPEDRSPDDHPE